MCVVGVLKVPTCFAFIEIQVFCSNGSQFLRQVTSMLYYRLIESVNRIQIPDKNVCLSICAYALG